MLSGNAVDPRSLFMPIFLMPGTRVREAIPTLPGISRLSVDKVAAEAAKLQKLGIGGVVLYGVPRKRDAAGSSAFGKRALVQKALIELRSLNITTVCDLCLCQYTPEGHCGVVNRDGEIDNDRSITLLSELGCELAELGASYLMPSSMLDGAVRSLKDALDRNHLPQTKIMSQSVKFASALYGSFRKAAKVTLKIAETSANDKGSGKEHYQLDPANREEAIRRIKSELDEGAHTVMVKPALGYGDVMSEAKRRYNCRIAAFSTGGEYGLILAGAAGKFYNRHLAINEYFTSIKRAGAELIVSYFAKEYAQTMAK